MSQQEERWPGDDMPDVPQDAAARRTRQAQDAHGGSMAPSMVDETGRPVAEPPETTTSTDESDL